MTNDQANRADVADLLRVVARAVKGGHASAFTVQWFGDGLVDIAITSRTGNCSAASNADVGDALAMVREVVGDDA